MYNLKHQIIVFQNSKLQQVIKSHQYFYNLKETTIRDKQLTDSQHNYWYNTYKDKVGIQNIDRQYYKFNKKESVNIKNNLLYFNELVYSIPNSLLQIYKHTLISHSPYNSILNTLKVMNLKNYQYDILNNGGKDSKLQLNTIYQKGLGVVLGTLALTLHTFNSKKRYLTNKIYKIPNIKKYNENKGNDINFYTEINSKWSYTKFDLDDIIGKPKQSFDQKQYKDFNFNEQMVYKIPVVFDQNWNKKDYKKNKKDYDYKKEKITDFIKKYNNNKINKLKQDSLKKYNEYTKRYLLNIEQVNGKSISLPLYLNDLSLQNLSQWQQRHGIGHQMPIYTQINISKQFNINFFIILQEETKKNDFVQKFNYFNRIANAVIEKDYYLQGKIFKFTINKQQYVGYITNLSIRIPQQSNYFINDKQQIYSYIYQIEISMTLIK